MRIFLSIINNLRHGKTNEQGHSGKSHRVYCGWSCAQKHHPCTHTRNSWKILSHRPSPERTSRESHQVRVRVFVCVRMCNARAHTCTHLTVIHTWEFRVQFQSVSPKHGQCVDAPRPAERQPLAQLKSIALAQRHQTLQSRHTQAALSALTAVD